MAHVREVLALAERLASGAVISPASKRRYSQITQTPHDAPSTPNYVPPKQLLLYLVRYKKQKCLFAFCSRLW